MSTNIFSGADQFKPDGEITINTVLFSLSIVLGVIWAIQFIIGIVCMSVFSQQQKYNPYVYMYTVFFTFKLVFAGIWALTFSWFSWLIIRSFWIQINCEDFKSGWIALFYLITGVMLILSVPMGLHALHISKALPLIFTIFIYLEVFMSALHVVHALVDRILYVYSNDKDLIEQMEELPSKTREQAMKDLGHTENPYSRTKTGFKSQNTKLPSFKHRKTEEILNEFSQKGSKLEFSKFVKGESEALQDLDRDSFGLLKVPSLDKPRRSTKSNTDFDIWDIIKARSDSTKIKNSPSRRKSKMVDVFNQNVLSKFNSKSESQNSKLHDQ